MNALTVLVSLQETECIAAFAVQTFSVDFCKDALGQPLVNGILNMIMCHFKFTGRTPAEHAHSVFYKLLCQ